MKTLARILLDRELVTEEKLAGARELQAERDMRLDAALLASGAVGEEALVSAVAEELGVPYVHRIGKDELDSALMLRVPREFALRNRLLPLRMEDGCAVIATSSPLDLAALGEVSSLLDTGIRLVAAPGEEITRVIHHSYPLAASAEDVIEDLTDMDVLEGAGEEQRDLLDMASQAPVIRLVNTILYRAVAAGASDVHIQPTEEDVKVRFRVDGMLHDVINPPLHVRDAVISRIKIMSHLNVAERRLPQDGRATVRVRGRAIDIRVSVIPTAFGERAVLRLLDKENLFLGLEELGMDTPAFGKVDGLIKRPHGIIFVTGPTGSGKTTTLYAALSSINSPEKNIITIEDPIEYQLGGISQIQVKPSIGLSFSNGLRSIVRQDPDVIMVGEVRDRETAEIATHAALTGHLVFSTLHTNDAAGAMTRLLEMGVEPYLVSSTVIAVLAQRLVRVIHEPCREPYEPGEGSPGGLGPGSGALAGRKLYRGRGCEECLNTGYRGRTGVDELLVVSDEIRELVLKRTASRDITAGAVRQGMVTLGQDGIAKVLEGVTTIEEVLRVTRD